MLHKLPKHSPTLFRLPVLALLLLMISCGGTKPADTGTTSGLPFKKLIQNAETAAANGDYLTAATSYRQAYNQKPRRTDILHRSAELFTRIRDYRQAASAYELLEPNEQDWPLLGLQYGRALKQDGRYDQARRQLALFREAYNGADRSIVTEIVNNELAGILLAQEQSGRETTIDIDRPGRGVNTSAEEFGPVAINADQLFFTSTQGGQSRLYQSRLQAKAWTKATVPPGFPVIAKGTFGTGTFHPNGRTFYFTICSGQTSEEATNRCEIFRGERSANGAWSQPEVLSSKINVPGSNNAYPFAATDANGRTLLYFASDRPGGRGGLDLYVSVEQDSADPDSFTVPTNLGNRINTVSDELSPAYDPDGGYLYFASSGHPGYGGLDVFRAAGALSDFGVPENPGPPVNSSADDYGLSLAANSGRAFLTSNRRYEDVKTTTVDSDIYSLNFKAGRARLKATVYDNGTSGELGGAEVTVIELLPDGTSRELGRREFPTGIYDFDLEPGRKYRVIIRREGYQGAEYQVETSLSGSSLYGQPVFLRRGSGQQPQRGITLPPQRDNGAGSRPAPSTSPAPAAAPDASPTGTVAREVAPVAYRIQLLAARKFDPADGKFEAVKNVGELRSESIPGRNLRRITVGYFTDKAAAKAGLRKAQSSGFSSAFVVRYDQGKYFGRVRL